MAAADRRSTTSFLFMRKMEGRNLLLPLAILRPVAHPAAPHITHTEQLGRAHSRQGHGSPAASILALLAPGDHGQRPPQPRRRPKPAQSPRYSPPPPPPYVAKGICQGGHGPALKPKSPRMRTALATRQRVPGLETLRHRKTELRRRKKGRRGSRNTQFGIVCGFFSHTPPPPITEGRSFVSTRARTDCRKRISCGFVKLTLFVKQKHLQ